MATKDLLLQNPLLGNTITQADNRYQQYRQTKQQISADAGFTYELSDSSYQAYMEGQQSIQQYAGLVDSIRKGKQDLLSIGLDENTINVINSIISEAADPVSLQNDLLTAVAFSENMGISVKDAMQNLDSLIEAQFFTPVPKGKTAAKAVKDSFYLGTLTLDRGHLGTKLMAQTPGSEEYNATLKQLQEIDAEMAERQDWMARPWYTELLKFSAQTLPYSMESMAAGGLGAGLVAVAGSLIPGAAPLIALSGIAAGVARFGQGFAVESGNLYYDLVSQGIDDNVARGVASGYGVLAATIEQALGGTVSRVLNGAGIPVKSVASKLTARMISSGALTNAAAKFAATYGTDVFMNGAEEFLQSFSSNAATNLAYVLSDLKAPKSVNDMLSEAWDEGVAGVAGSLFLGGFGAGLDVRMNAKQGIGISNAAQNIHSKAQYENVVSKSYRPEGITDSDWQELIDAAWNQNAEHREMTWSDGSYAAYAGAEISANEAVYSMQGKAYEAQGAEEMKGKNLFFQDRKTETSAGTVHTMLFGNPDQLGIGASRYSAMQKQEAQMDLTAEDMEALQQKSLKMPKIGEITYRTKGGTLEILSAGMEEGYQDLQRQAVEQLISMYPDYDIQWKNPGELQAIYDDIVASNPKGEQAGLNYGTRYDSADTETVKRWIGNKFSSDAEEQSVMAAILQSYAGRMNLSGEEFISKYLEDIGTIDEKIEEEIRNQGVDPEKVKGFTKFSRESARAIIYAGKNADLSTFDHELNHVVMSIGENKADFEKAVHDAIKTNRKRLDKFIQQNIDIIKSATGKDGKYDPSFVDKLYQRAEGDTRNWTRAEEEFEAELFEAYRRKGETLNPELKGILKRIAEAYRRIYRALRNALGTSLNEEIRDYYDRLHGFDRTGADQGRDFSGWKITPNLSLSQEESDSIASQSYAEQFAYIRDKYVGTENYMRAPNGSASNLTEEQWIMVRTPNFKAWFGDWENDPENASKVVDENGEPREVYHGTYGGEFDVFDIEKGNFESDMGRGFYFTSNYYDMSNNYEEGGPDFDNKIDRLAESLINEDEELDYDEAKEKAREILFVGGSSFDVFLNMRNPAYVDSTRLFEFESSLDMDDFSDEDEYYDAVNEEIDQKFAEAIDNAISKAQDEGINFDEDELRGILGELAYEGVGISEAKERLMVYSSADNGDFADNELLRCVIEACGFDGIIDSTVSDKFANMNIEEGTSHFIAFKPNQIKSATDNSGAFSAGNDSILYQTAGEKIKSLKAEYKDFIEDKEYWNNKHFSEFYAAYPDAVLNVIAKYPKVSYDGILMLAELESKFMPYQKEHIQAKILKEYFGSDYILLPSKLTPISDIFGVKLNTSVPDIYGQVFDFNSFIELKYVNYNVAKNLKSTLKQHGIPVVFAADIKDDWIARWENEEELKNYSHFEYIIVDIKGKKFLIHSVKKGPLYKALLRYKAGISSAHHLSGVALMPNSIMEMKPSPLVELYIDELKAVKHGATIPYEAYLAAKKELASPQVESDSSLLFQSSDGDTDAEIENGNLYISHTITQRNLIKAASMGGFPMPSLAITKPRYAGSTRNYGEIVLIGGWKMGQGEIEAGTVYDRDLWSPMYPDPQYAYGIEDIVEYVQSVHRKYSYLNTEPLDITATTIDVLGAETLDDTVSIFVNVGSYPALAVEYLNEMGIEHSDNIGSEKYHRDLRDLVYATRESLDSYRSWLKGKLSKFYDAPYIMVGEEQKPYTLENVLAYLMSKDIKGNKFHRMNTTGNLFALAARNFKSREDMRSAEGMLDSDSPESVFSGEMGALAEALEGNGFAFEDYNNALEGVRQFLAGNMSTKEDMANALDEQYRVPAVIDAAYNLAEALSTNAASLGYFEAKPGRIIRLNEFSAAVVPSDISVDAYELLNSAGLKIMFYDTTHNYYARENAIRELVSREKGYLFQEETPQEIWLEDIQNIANGCTDYEQFRIAVDAFAMGEPTESAEADMLAAWKSRKAPSSSYTNSPDEEPIDWEADWDTLAVDYGEHTDYEMYDDDTEEFIITSWAMARETDEEEAEAARTTLENPNSYHVSREDRQDDFVAILDHDDQLYAYLSALRRASRTIAFGSERDLDFDPAAEPERYERLKEASQKIQQEVAPFVRNVIFGKDDASWDIKSLPDRTKSIIRGIIANNPGDYMDLYYLASNNAYWHDSMDLQSEIEQEAARIAAEKGLTIAEKRKLVQELGDKDLEEKIIRTGDITNADVRGLLIRKRQRAEEARKEYELIQDMLNERIAYKDGKIVQITLQAKEAQESLYKVGKELSEVNAQLEHTAARLSKKAKGMGLDTKIVQEQQELIRKKAHLERLYSQRSSILRNLFNEGKYYGRAGEQKISEIDARIGSLLEEIVALEQSEVLTQDEAIEKIISLTSLIEDKKARDRLYKTVTLERWKAAKKLGEERAKAEKKLHDTIYVERLKASNAIKAEQQKAEDRLLAQRMHDAVIYGRAYGRKIQKLEDAIKSMKQAKAQERAARKLKKEMQRLADGIMRKPSAAIHLDEAEQILKIQMAFDPAFRSKMRVAGSMMDINDLKDMLKNDPSNPLLTMLTEDQLRRLLKKSLDEMSLAELQAIAESVKNLREKGRAKREAYLINQRIETRNIQSLLIQQLMSSSKYKEPEFHGSLEERERMKSDRWRARYLSTYSMARQAQMLDDNHKGNFYNLLIRRKRDRQNAEARAILERRKPVEDAVEINGISFDDFYSESVEVSIDGKKATFTLSQLAYVYLAKNNEKNRAAVAYGNLISQAEKGAVENGVKARIIGTGKDFEQARRDAANEEIRKIGDRRYAELYAYAEEAINGNPAAKAVVAEIEASLNSDRFSDVVELMRREFNMEVTREAYYLPLNRVGFVGESPAERLQADILNQVPGMRATVDKGSTIARQIISPLHQSEVDLDLIKVWDNSIYDQEHLLAFLEYARLLDHVFKAGLSGRTRELREAIENSHGPAMMKSIDAFINEVANPSSAAIARDMNQLVKIMRLLRGNMYAATFGFRVSSVLNQLITSPAAFLGKVSPLELSRSAMMFMAHPIEMWNRVCELSPFMANRDADIILGRFREAAEKQGQSKAQEIYSQFLDIAMKGMEWSDRYTVGIGWYAIFEKELKALGGVESPENIAKAVKVADEYVQETQPQGDETELSALVKNDAFSLIAPFQTALNTVWQDVTYDIPVAFKDGRYVEAIGKMTGYAIAGVLLALVHGELQPDEDDEKRGLAIARRMLFGATTQFTEPFPLVGDMISNLFQLVITGEKEMLYNSSDFPALDTIYKGFTAAYDKKWAKALESIIYGAGQLFGAPISEIKDIRRAIENEDIRAIFGWRD